MPRLRSNLVALLLIALCGVQAPGAEAPKPTMSDVAYGPHERNVLDFWKAESQEPTPVVVFIHGGGFANGDKSKVGGDKTIRYCLANGISFAAINYRYRTSAPIQDVLRDCGRAIQFIRSNAGKWNVDKARIASYGGSAGAGTSLWLAFHDDLADPNSSDPVLRESSRLVCAGANATQFSYDILRWNELFGQLPEEFNNATDGQAFYGFAPDFDLKSPEAVKVRNDCDMCGLITKDDPPVFVSTDRGSGEIKNRGDLLHHPKHAKAIYDRCKEVGIEAVASLPTLGIEPKAGEPATMQVFLVEHLKAAKSAAAPAATDSNN